MNNRCQLIAVLVLCSSLVSTVASTSTGGGKLRRRQVGMQSDEEQINLERATNAHDARELGTDDEYSLTFDTPEPLSCISVIAVDAFRRNPFHHGKNKTKADNDKAFNYYPDADAIVTYDANPQIETDEEFLCELSSGAIAGIQGTDEQFTTMRKMLNNGTLISAESNVEMTVQRIPSIVTAEGIPDRFAKDEVIVSLPTGNIKLIEENESIRRRLTDKRRKLGNRYEGNKKILLIRITDVDGRSIPETARQVSDKFFGTYGDAMTVKSGFESCSFGAMQITSDYSGTSVNDSVMSAPGVVDVTIGLSLSSASQVAIIEAAATAAMKKMDIGLPGPFAHVIFILEDCYSGEAECNFAAYGYVNHWVLVTLGQNWAYPAVIMHELGHNLNLAHSGGLDGGSYTDHTCLMGNPLFSDDVGRMCFNPVKNFQIAMGSGGWYEDEHIQSWNSGTTGGTSWSGKIIGLADYGSNPNDLPFILKLETGTASDYFVSFNRASGVNSEVQQAANQVTLYQVDAGEGVSYSRSTLKAAIQDGRSATIENWRKSGKDLTIRVVSINTSSSPSYTQVLITFGQQPQSKASVPAKSSSTASGTSSSASSIVTFNSGTTDTTKWTGDLAAVNENGNRVSYNNLFPTAVHLYTGGSYVYLEYFNGAVLLQMKKSDGSVRSMGSIAEGTSEAVVNWMSTAYDLVITVRVTSTYYASVSITFRP